jgi:hypothetical protein
MTTSVGTSLAELAEHLSSIHFNWPTLTPMAAHVGQGRYREAVAAFITIYHDKKPWYFSIQAKGVNDDLPTTFVNTLGLSNKTGMALLKAAGLVSIRVVTGKPVLRVEHD